MDSGMCSGKYREHRQTKDALTILLASVGVTAFIIGITSAEAAHYYFFMAWFAAAVLVAVMVDHMSEGQPVFAGLILTAVALFAVLNLKYTYYEAATTQDNLKEYQEVADYLTEAGIDYGYAEFWDAERICLITDGRVTMGHSYTMASLSGYWWLTSTNGIPRRCPRKCGPLTSYGQKCVKPLNSNFRKGKHRYWNMRMKSWQYMSVTEIMWNYKIKMREH